MNGQKNLLPNIGKILYGAGGLCICAEVVLLLTFVKCFAKISGAVLSVCVPLGIILPVAVMPLIYYIINGSTSISLGRYHLPMAVSALFTALSAVLLTGLNISGVAGQAFVITGLMLLHSFSLQTFLYCYYSMGRRFDHSGKAYFYRLVFSVAGIAVAALITLLCFKFTVNSARSCVVIAAIISTVSFMLLYFASVRSLPSFVRVEPRHRRKAKEIYIRFFAPLLNKNSLLFSVATAALYAAAASAIAGLYLVFAVSSYAVRAYRAAVLIWAVIIIPVFLFSSVVFKEMPGYKRAIAPALLTAALVLSACCAAIMPFTGVSYAVVITFMFVFAALSAGSVGALLASECASREYSVRLSGVTPGRLYCFKNCMAALGIAAGLTVISVINAVSRPGSNAAPAATVITVAIFAAAGALLLYFGYKKAGGAEKKQAGEELCSA